MVMESDPQVYRCLPNASPTTRPRPYRSMADPMRWAHAHVVGLVVRPCEEMYIPVQTVPSSLPACHPQPKPNAACKSGQIVWVT
jgi:hypothetical protein